MSNVPNLPIETSRFVELKAQLLATYDDLDEQTLRDTLEGATDFKEALAALVRSALQDEALCEGLRGLLDTMKRRLDRLETRATTKRRTVLETMEHTGYTNLFEPDFTVSLRKAPASVLIMAEDQIPRQFLVPQPPRIDKRGILAAFAAGAPVPGAQLSHPRNSLSVRTL